MGAIRALTNQSSKLVAALRCEADANCSPVCPALERATLSSKAAAFLFALHCNHQGSHQPVEQACCSAVRGGCKLCACLSGTRRSNLVKQRLPPSSLLCTAFIMEHLEQSNKLVAALRCEADATCVPVWPALAGATLSSKAAAFLFAVHGSHQGALGKSLSRLYHERLGVVVSRVICFKEDVDTASTSIVLE